MSTQAPYRIELSEKNTEEVVEEIDSSEEYDMVSKLREYVHIHGMEPEKLVIEEGDHKPFYSLKFDYTDPVTEEMVKKGDLEDEWTGNLTFSQVDDVLRVA